MITNEVIAMIDYKSLYYELFRSMSDTIDHMVAEQQRLEERYLSSQEKLLEFPAKEESPPIQPD